MQKTDYSILELNKKNILSFSPYLPEENLHAICQKNVGAMGLVKDKTASCGALLYSVYPEKGICFLDSICVDETQREQGNGCPLFADSRFLISAGDPGRAASARAGSGRRRPVR